MVRNMLDKIILNKLTKKQIEIMSHMISREDRNWFTTDFYTNNSIDVVYKVNKKIIIG